ncbi:MAG: hypothetical protein JWM58_3669 [Rhizobium sp.]|nr:hypothetical protein [Rhizobium sp.]
MMRHSDQRLTIVQYAGDFREASQRLAAGGAENYRAQRYTVDYVEQLAASMGSVTTITGFTKDRYDVVLPSGARAIGAGFVDKWDASVMIGLIEQTRPDRIILRTPMLGLLRWVVRSRIPTLALLADSFQAHSLKERLKRFLTVRYLNSDVIEQIGNHGRNAARQLAAVGVDPKKIIAWDYPAMDKPGDRPAKTGAGGRKLIYVGMLSAAKGVDDLLHAAARLQKSGAAITLDLIGAGDSDRLKQLSQKLEIDQLVRFVGLVPNNEIIQRMRDADLVVVPSRHEYPEGLPLTIYEAFCSRTPLVASDHPMFLENIVHEQSGLLFRAGDPLDLSRQISRLLDDPALYRSLSSNSDDAWQRIQISDTWADVIDRWLEGNSTAK